MRHLISCMVLLLATSVLAQQQGPPPSANPPYQTPPTFPEGGQTPREQMPPDTQAPSLQQVPSQRIEALITDQFGAEPMLSGTNIDARVDDKSVLLTGSVNTMMQHDLAVRIAQSNAGDRKIVDKIMIKQQTTLFEVSL